MKCTDDLMQDHENILRSLNVLRCMAKGDSAEPLDYTDAYTLLRFLRVFADEHHHMKEESVLFPEVLPAIGESFVS